MPPGTSTSARCISHPSAGVNALRLDLAFGVEAYFDELPFVVPLPPPRSLSRSPRP